MIQPLGKNITAEVAKAESVSGLILTEQIEKQLAPKKATITAVGDDVTKVKVGDVIIYKTYATFELELDKDKPFIVLEEQDILGIVK